MIFKATILKSNPHIIRELYINEEKTVRDLLTVLEISYGWTRGNITNSMNLSMWNMSKGHVQDVGKPTEIDISFSMTCIEFFQRYDEVLVKFPMKKNHYSRWDSSPPENWKIVLSLIEEESYEIEEEGEDAFLFRAYGMHPLWDVSTMRENNQAHQNLFMEGYTYVSGVGEIEIEQYELDVDKMNRTLIKLSASSGIRKGNRSIGKKLKDILQLYKVDELKRCIQENHLDINPYQRKNQLIADIDKAYRRKKFWDTVLQEMSWQEYDAFKNLCFSNGDGMGIGYQYSYPILTGYCLIYQQSFESPRIADSFMDYYMDMMETKGDDELIHSKKWQQVFSLATELYGVYDKLMCKKLAQVMYPDDLDSNEIMSVWREAREWKALNAFYMYGPKFFYYKKSVYEVINSDTYQTINTYIPTKEEAFDILKNGLTYPKAAANTIIKATSYLDRSYYWQDDQELFLKKLYQLVRSGANRNEIWEIMRFFGYSGSKQNRTQFFDVVDKYLPEVRLFEYRGFTEYEYNQRRK